MPSSSARCSQLPRCVDKLPFYVALRKLRDNLRGDLPNLDDSEVTFPDLELKVEPKKEKLDAEVKQEITDPRTRLTSEQPVSSSTFQLNVETKTEGDLVTRKQRKGRRERLSTVGRCSKETAAPAAVSSSDGTVCSPYFQPWRQPSLCFSETVANRNCMTTATVFDRLKQEMPIDFEQYGCMPVDLSGARTNSGVLPLPDV